MMSYLLAWQNLLFLIPLCVGMLLVVGSAMGLGHGDIGHDMDHDLDHNHDLGHGAESDQGSADSRIHALDHADHEIHHETSLFFKMFSILGVGRVPLSIVLMVASLLFGGIGFIMNTLLAPMLITPWIYAWLSLAGAFVGTVSLTGAIARLVHRLMPTTETYRVSKRDLVGRTGTLVLGADAGSGLLQVYDHEGNLHQVSCRTREGMIPKGREVLVVEHDQAADTYLVEASPLVRQDRSSAV